METRINIKTSEIVVSMTINELVELLSAIDRMQRLIDNIKKLLGGAAK